MLECDFSFLTPGFFAKAEVYPGSLGTFRYRFQRNGKIGEGSLQVWVYENTSFELAKDTETETFPWTEEGKNFRQLQACPAAGIVVYFPRF